MATAPKFPIVIRTSHSISAIDDTSTFFDNGDNRILYSGGWITRDTVIRDPGIPYFVQTYRIRIYNDSTLTINPGAELQFGSGGQMIVGDGSSSGKLIAQGSDDDPVKLTATSSKGWKGIDFTSTASADSVLENAIVEYSGGIGINSSPTIRTSTIRYSDYGFYVGSGSPEIYCNTITANGVGIVAEGVATPIIHNNDIRGNTRIGFRKVGSAVVDAENNYWGAADGPGGDGPGSGDTIVGTVSGDVDFVPFLTASAPCTAPLNASFSATPVEGCQALTVTLTDDSTGGASAWEWDFDGDGTIDSTLQNPSYTYAEPATYTATLSVYRDGGASSSASMSVSVLESVPVAAFTASPVTGEPPLEVTFTDQSASCGTDNIVEWFWDFDNDGLTDSTDQNPSNVFYEGGSYTISLTVTDSDGDSNTLTKQELVYVSDEAPIAEPGGSYVGTEGQAIQFDGSGSYDPNGGTITFAWDFDGDGNTDSTAEQPVYAFAQDSGEQPGGAYNVTLTVTDETGMTGVATVAVTVADIDPQAAYDADVTSGTQPLTVQFNDISSSYDGITGWHWSFGNGTESTEQNPQVTYAQAGVYSVTLEVTEDDGDTSAEVKTGYISVGSCTVYYYDADADGYGTNLSLCLASPASPYTAQVSGDCDDNNAGINPGATEICGDGIDNNCNGNGDEACPVPVSGDLDGDGVVDSQDYIMFRGTLGKCRGAVGYVVAADYDADGCVTYRDYRTWYFYFQAYQAAQQLL